MKINHNRPFPTDRDRCILSVEVTYTNMISLVEEQVHFLPNRWQKLELELELFTILVIQLKNKAPVLVNTLNGVTST